MSTFVVLINEVFFRIIYRMFRYHLVAFDLFGRLTKFFFSVKYLSPLTFSTLVRSTSDLLRFLERIAASKLTAWLS